MAEWNSFNESELKPDTKINKLNKSNRIGSSIEKIEISRAKM